MVALHTDSLGQAALRPLRRVDARPRRVAVVLNANARKVDDETIRWIGSAIPRDDLYLSRSFADGKKITARLLAEGYDVVLWGGGDGTFAAGVADMARTADELGVAHLPQMGILRLGTGNALADAVGAGPATADGLADDIRRARRSGRRRTLPLLDVEGRPAMFCGFGLDAQILEDLGATVERLRKLKLEARLRSAGLRYFLAVTGRSLPRFLTSSRPEIVAVNRGAPAVRVDVDGNPVGDPIPAGRVLWRGHATLASAGTIPFYGLGLKVFPHADRQPGRFQLRLSDAGAAEILGNLPKIWRGRYASPRVHDFLVDAVELVLSRPAPFQANGDLCGSRSGLTIGRWGRTVELV